MEGGEQGNLATRVHVQQSVSTGLGDDMATGYRQKAVWIAVEVRCSVGVEAAVRIECRLVRRDVVDIAQAAVWQELDQPAEPISNLAQERSIGRIGLQSDREVRSPEPGDPEIGNSSLGPTPRNAMSFGPAWATPFGPASDGNPVATRSWTPFQSRVTAPVGP